MRRSLFFLLFLSLFLNILAQKKVELEDPNSFSMILLPDLQSYSKFDYNQPIMNIMTEWVQREISNLKIKAVLCTGDLVEQNEYLVPKGFNGNQTSVEQWIAVSNAFSRLDNKVPYMICPGNHDYGYERSENRRSEMKKYFPVERNNKWKESLIEVYNDSFGSPTIENSIFELKDSIWGDLLIVTTEFAPRNEVLEWVKNKVTEDKYKDHKVIFMTHSFLNADGTIIEKENYKLSNPNYGKAVWDKLISQVPNIKLVICGHYCVVGGFKENVGFRSEKNIFGNIVHEMMFNAQTAGGGWNGNGGDGWLRILEFKSDGKTISVKTYSPLFGISPTTEQFAWRTDSYDEFKIIIK